MGSIPIQDTEFFFAFLDPGMTSTTRADTYTKFQTIL